ncbi:MAG TPA: trigger factor [Solirubrobacteraceae bacterium]|jgi:trigger factor|nr:trigger factor [Solirubrobacteraceae bacterium]
MKTTVTELPESRVRVEAEVPADEVQKRLNQTAQSLGSELRIPGFRKGKVPPPVVIRRIGREAVLDETIRSSLGRWYVAAIDDAGIAPIGDPTLAVGDPPPEGQPLTFSIEIGVRPKARLGEYRGVEVGRREPQVEDAQVDAEVEALRERLARLDTVEEPAENGDFVVMDYRGSVDGTAFEGGEGRDQLVELGSGRLIPGFEEQLTGASAGEERTVEVAFPPDYPAQQLAGRDAVFEVTVKEVKRKRLPELDDDFAVEAAGFDSLQELRDDVRKRLEEAEERQIDAEFRQAALDAAVAEAKVDVPEQLVADRAREVFEQTMHSLGHQGISKEAYLRIAGKGEDELVAEAQPDAEQALRREAVLTAIVAAEGIEVSDEEVLEALGADAERSGVKPKKLLDRLRSEGRLDAVKEDLAARKALDLVAEHAKAIPVEQAQARDKLWTPEKEASEAAAGGASGRLWTPGSSGS